MKEQGGKPTLEVSTQPNGRRMEICLYCGNRTGEVCVTRCALEGKYRYLSPEVLPDWESYEEVPFSKLVDWSPAARLAALYLMAHYRRK